MCLLSNNNLGDDFLISCSYPKPKHEVRKCVYMRNDIAVCTKVLKWYSQCSVELPLIV